MGKPPIADRRMARGEMMDAMVKGWCPGALRPMESGDGLIVRLKISSGIVDAGLATHIARWSRRWGNGQIDLTGRANLQLRGLSVQHLAELHDAMADWHLLDHSAAAEAVRNVISSPLAGLDPTAVLDVRPIVSALEQRLATDTALHELPGKFGFAIDDGGRLGLEGVPGDVRFDAHFGADGPEFTVCLDGASLPLCPDAPGLGPCGPDVVADVAAALAGVFLDARKGGQISIRRMGDLVALWGVEAIGQRAGLAHAGSPRAAGRPADPSMLLGTHRLGSAAYLGVGLPFGRIVAEDLGALAAAVIVNGGGEIRLTPWRAILVPVPSILLAHAVSRAVATSTFILDPHDPRRRIAACPGAPSCAHGTTPVHLDAARLAVELAGATGSHQILHVSGCEKGCAHPKPASITLVARHGRYDLVRNGVPSDAPALRELTVDQAADQLRPTVADQVSGGPP
ncbi:MAG TPA: precorrin-3B synthase [Acetobacteraceae bacterium]|nr:precorrin-3B synthase [Acetobacteraceae bacterium]